MLSNPYTKATFLKSCAKINQLPDDGGYEIAFAGRSNAGKSSALNCLTQNNQLAKTSKTPGRTQLINLFTLDHERRLVDLPGYGYAKVNLSIKEEWQKTLTRYLSERQCLKGIILLMDCRHPLKELDQNMIDFCIQRDIPVHILLTKVDKISRNELTLTLKKVKQAYDLIGDMVTVSPFSSLKKQGLEDLIRLLNQWYKLSS